MSFDRPTGPERRLEARTGVRGAGRGRVCFARPRAGGFTLVEIMLVVVVLGVVLAISVPSFLRSRVVAHEASAASTLRNLVTAESAWRQNDVDRNGIADYWTADLSGFYRMEVSPAGSGQFMSIVDEAVAAADDNKESGGAAVAGMVLPETGQPGASLLGFVRNAPRTGYFYRALVSDLSVAPAGVYRADPDGNTQDWSSTSRFGYQARPDVYGTNGINTILINESGVAYLQDFGNNLATNGQNWPAADPTSAGWRRVQ
ncbi:MAG: DUF2950 family protein [Planctomycetes bacterium]|nr:DUF2950 family protein [Planctomycetota bacterium]